MSRFLATPLLLVRSNILMSFSWYGHLKAPHWPLWRAILVSWGIAFFEYCLRCRPTASATAPSPASN